MNSDKKIMLKKYSIYGIMISIVLILLNFIIRNSFFPYVGFGRSIIYYLIYTIASIFISIIFGSFYELLKSKLVNKLLHYTVLTFMIIIYFSLLLIILFIINVFISFNRPF